MPAEIINSGLEKGPSRLVHSQEIAGSSPAPAPKTWPGLNEGLGLKLNNISHPGLGLAPLKTEGEALPYDPGAASRGRPLTRGERRMRAVAQRLRYLPARLWWALFGDEYW